MAGDRVRVVVEAGDKRAFASAADWPGWARGGKTEGAALEALAAYAARYAPIANAAGHPLAPDAATRLEVAERLPGDASTAFGVPGRIAELDRRSSDAADSARLVALVDAAWGAFDATAASAPAELVKGPRGGGRDTPKIVAHVLGAESAYARQLGLRFPEPDPADRAAVAALRSALRDVLGRPSDGAPIHRWPQRYAARRIAWHVLDHLWEIEDRTLRP